MIIVAVSAKKLRALSQHACTRILRLLARAVQFHFAYLDAARKMARLTGNLASDRRRMSCLFSVRNMAETAL